MVRAIRFLGVLPLLFVSGHASRTAEIPEANEIPNWPAPALWTPPAARSPRGARADAVSPALPPLPFIALTPCRIADTRGNGFAGAYGPPALPANATRDFIIAGQCGIPASAAAVSFNFAALNVGAPGDLRVFPAGGGVPTVSTLNYNGNTPNIANAAVVSLGTAGAITVQADAASIDLIIDVNGYYDGSGALQLSLSRRAALDQFWTSQNAAAVGLTTVGATPLLLKSDGADVWVANFLGGGTVSRVRASDGKSLESWTGALNAFGVVVAMGRVIVTGSRNPGNLYLIDPSQVAGAVTTVASNLGNGPHGITFDGARVWTANASGSVSIITPGATIPWTVTTVTTGFSSPNGALYDGANVWVTDINTGTLLRLDSSGVIVTTVTVGDQPQFPVFDGTNIWVPNNISNSISVVRASDGAVVQTLTGNGLNGPVQTAFDGQRVLVTNNNGATATVSLWKAADLAPLGSFTIGPGNVPFGACSDEVNFWITLPSAGKLVRF
ncbi:MAG TPA: hypothetical protein VLS25_01835 [Dehalococcoidia bacterium]|nr:hypothetical protein [Dehalococcoidia bacterium]